MDSFCTVSQSRWPGNIDGVFCDSEDVELWDT